MRSSRYAQISVSVTTTATIAITPTVQNQIVEATLSGTGYTVTFPSVTSATFPCRVAVVRFGAASQGVLSLAGLNNYGGTVKLFNDQDCAVFEVVNTTGSTYAWELVGVMTTGSVPLSTTPFTSTWGDMAKAFDITTGASAFVFNLPALSSSAGKEYIIAKVDAGAGAVAVTPNGGDLIGSVNAAFSLASQGATLHIINNGSAWDIIALGRRNFVITSGSLGTLPATSETTYILTAASTATFPASPQPGCRLTFKAKTTATSTISANAGQTIGTTGSTAFSLYAQDDSATFEYDGVSIWYVMATSGPLLSSNQTGSTSTSTSSAWTAIANGLSLGTVQPGVYDLELACTIVLGVASNLSIGLGNGTSLISESIGAQQGVAAYPLKVTLKNYVLTAAATIQGLYYSNNSGNSIAYASPAFVGKITARRVG